MENLDKRVEALEKQVNILERRVDLNERDIKAIFSKLDKIEGNTSKIIWMILTAVILAILNTILKGGILS